MQDIIYETSQGYLFNLMDVSLITPVTRSDVQKQGDRLTIKVSFFVYFKGSDEPQELAIASELGGSNNVSGNTLTVRGEAAIHEVEKKLGIERKRLDANWRALLDAYYWGMRANEENAAPEPSKPMYPLCTEELLEKLKLWAENREDAGYDSTLLHLAIKRIEASPKLRKKFDAGESDTPAQTEDRYRCSTCGKQLFCPEESE